MDQRIPGPFESFSSGKVATSMPRPLQRFYKGEPLALGITQIFTGLLEIAFGTVLAFIEHHYFEDIHVKTPLWAGILYIISGSLSVAAAKNPKMPLVKSTLVMNIVSAVAAGIVIGISSYSIRFQRPPGSSYSACAYGLNDTQVIQNCHIVLAIPYSTMYNMVAFLFTLTVLEFLIAIISSAFGCASVCRHTYSETTIVIFQNAAEASPPPPPPAP